MTELDEFIDKMMQADVRATELSNRDTHVSIALQGRNFLVKAVHGSLRSNRMATFSEVRMGKVNILLLAVEAAWNDVEPKQKS